MGINSDLWLRSARPVPAVGGLDFRCLHGFIGCRLLSGVRGRRGLRKRQGRLSHPARRDVLELHGSSRAVDEHGRRHGVGGRQGRGHAVEVRVVSCRWGRGRGVVSVVAVLPGRSAAPIVDAHLATNLLHGRRAQPKLRARLGQTEVHQILEISFRQKHSQRAPPQFSLPQLSARMDHGGLNRALHVTSFFLAQIREGRCWLYCLGFRGCADAALRRQDAWIRGDAGYECTSWH